MPLTPREVSLVQETLVNIWQAHIQEWHDGDVDAPDSPDDDQPSSYTAHASSGVGSSGPTSSGQDPNTDVPRGADTLSTTVHEQRGHRIQHYGTGAFCVKCGKTTARLKHINLRILKRPCPFPDLPQHSWMATPGNIHSTARLDEQERILNEKYNARPKHHLIWNRQTGRNTQDPKHYGRLWCRVCGRTFAWRYRVQNLPKTVCRAVRPPPSAPDWVTEILQQKSSQSAPNQTESVSNFPRPVTTTSSSSTSSTRRRLMSKTSVSAWNSLNTSTSSRPADLPLGSSFPRQGIG